MQEELFRLLGANKVLSGKGVSRAYDCDAYTVDKSKPAIVVLPESTNEVAEIVRWCIKNSIPYTPRGAGTGLSGGALPALGGVVISTKRLDKILNIDIPNRQMLAQTGIANVKLSQAVQLDGLHFAPDPSSQSVSTLGGNIAENSGGPHTLKYGVTANHILEVTMVNELGEIEKVGSRVPGGPGPNWLSLIVGAEGTTGIVTEAWIQLTPLPKLVKTCLIAFGDVPSACKTVADIIGSGVIPAALEMMDKGILAALNAAFKLEYPAGTQALLLVECDGDEPTVVEGEMSVVVEIATSNGALNVEVAKDEKERTHLWTARKKGIGAMGRLAPSIVTHDGVIPRSKLPEMLDFVYAVAAEHGLGVANLFHAGDGNLHPCFYFDEREPGMVEKVIEAGEVILAKCVELGGSVSGEHGIGVEKADLMQLMFSPEDLEFQAMGKAVFSRSELLNPCKVLPNQKSCVEHKKRWRGAAW